MAAGGGVTEEEVSARAGTSALIMFGGAFGPSVLEELGEDDEPDELDEDGALEDRAGEEPAADVDPHQQYRATPKAGDMLRVVFALRGWLERRPGAAPEPTHDPGAGPAIVALIGGWSSTVLHALAAAPLTPVELRRAIRSESGEVVTEVLAELERAGIVAPQHDEDEAPRELTEWGREAIAPIVAAVLYERLHPIDCALPPDVLDVEAAFQMALPLLELPQAVSGRCRLGVWVPSAEASMAGATVEVAEGRVASSTTLLEESPDNFVTGLALPWCEAVIDPSAREKLKSDGDEQLIDTLLTALHERLFGDLLGDLRSPFLNKT